MIAMSSSFISRCCRWIALASIAFGMFVGGTCDAQQAVSPPTTIPCGRLSGTYQNTGPIIDGPERHRGRTGLHWRVFDGARLDYPGLNGKIDAVRLETVDERSIRVTAIDRDGTPVGPYLLGSKTPWRCIGDAFVNETDSPLGGEGNLGDVHERTSISTDASGNLLYETITTSQRRTGFLLGGKIGKPEVTRRAFVFQRLVG